MMILHVHFLFTKKLIDFVISSCLCHTLMQPLLIVGNPLVGSLKNNWLLCFRYVTVCLLAVLILPKSLKKCFFSLVASSEKY